MNFFHVVFYANWTHRYKTEHFKPIRTAKLQTKPRFKNLWKFEMGHCCPSYSRLLRKWLNFTRLDLSGNNFVSKTSTLVVK